MSKSWNFVVKPDANWTPERKHLQESLASGDVVVCVVVSTSFIDHALSRMLARLFIKGSTSEKILDHNKGILGSLNAKSDLAYCLGLIPKTLYQNLKTIAELRNKIAHRLEDYTFYHEEIAPFCNKLLIPANPFKSLPVIEYSAVNPQKAPTSPRIRFYYAVSFVHSDLEARTALTITSKTVSDGIWGECI
jgi:DNA-binding MltR family transcriptional regulator